MTNNNDNHTPSGTAGTPHRRSPHSERYSRPVPDPAPRKGVQHPRRNGSPGCRPSTSTRNSRGCMMDFAKFATNYSIIFAVFGALFCLLIAPFSGVNWSHWVIGGAIHALFAAELVAIGLFLDGHRPTRCAEYLPQSHAHHIRTPCRSHNCIPPIDALANGRMATARNTHSLHLDGCMVRRRRGRR